MNPLLSAVFLAQALPQASPPPTFPDAFVGVWDVSAEACGGSHSTYRIRIEPQLISYWESDGTPIELFGAGDREVQVKLGMSGEGESWESRTRFVLSADGDQLFAEALPQVGRDYFKTTWFYHRCPADAPMGNYPE